ncbi:MAG: hypothetical protein K6F93_05515 [Lachnospiraceae bacterium]|nr:hypothetical protein [Lachnospiraceae bacterium]
MKNLKKALEFYLKISSNSTLICIGMIFLALGPAMLLSIDERDQILYVLPISLVPKIGILFMLLQKTLHFSKSKACVSLPFSKELYTIIPTVVSASFTLIYDITLIILHITFKPQIPVSNFIVMSALGSFVIFLMHSTIRKPVLHSVYSIAWIIVIGSTTFSNLHMNLPLPNLSLGASIITGIMIYIAGIGATILIQRIWWKKCNHIFDYNSVNTQF